MPAAQMPAPAAVPPAQLLDLLQFLPAQQAQQGLGLLQQQQQLQLPVAAGLLPLPAQPAHGLTANGPVALAAQQAAGVETEDQPAMDLSEGGL
mgnify:CR=1 FL=1